MPCVCCAAAGRTTVTVVRTLSIRTLPALSGAFILSVAPSAERDIHNAQAAYDVDHLVRMFRCAHAVELDQHVIYGARVQARRVVDL